MNANWIYILVVTFFLAVSLYLYIASLKLGLKWANVADISYLKAFGLWLLLLYLPATVVGIAFLSFSIEWSRPIEAIIELTTRFIVSSLVVALIYKSTLRKSAKAMLPNFLVGIASIAAVIFILRPFIYESFEIPTNAMAPTLLGAHLEAPCPNCGSSAYGNPSEGGHENGEDGVLMICSNELKTVMFSDLNATIGGSDRIAVCKLIEPRRWDLVVFRYPEDPSIIYVKRLIGLPGEHLSIRDGAVWINHQKLEPPAVLRGIEYQPTIEWKGTTYSGPGSAPVTLGADEYFVLGDFSAVSSDSRMWERGAPGHAPYAVPESHIVGVTINIYWPINRWRAFR